MEHIVPSPIAAAVTMVTKRRMRMRTREREGEKREEKLFEMSRMASVIAAKQDCRQ